MAGMAEGPHRTFVRASLCLPSDPLWRHRRLSSAACVLFFLSGAHALLPLPRERWAFPLKNPRPLLLMHWATASPFLAGVVYQRLTLGAIASAGTMGNSAAMRRRHRLVGRATLACSAVAASTALMLAPGALAGANVFRAWAAAWIFLTLMTWRTAMLRQWELHRSYAEALSRTGLAFVAGRIVLGVYAYCHALDGEPLTAKESSESYHLAIAFTGAATLVDTLWVARQSLIVRRARRTGPCSAP